MKSKVLLTALTLCFFLGQLDHAFAEQTSQAQTQNDLYDRLIQEGWTLTAAGVLQRQIGAGKVETLGFGVEGLRFKLKELRSQLAFLREEYRQRPLPEIRRSIRAYRTQIARVSKALSSSKVAKEIDVETAKAGIDCTIQYGAHVDAFPLSSSVQGVGAKTDSYFNSNCGQTGEVYAHAYGRATGTDNTIRTFSLSDPTSGPSLGRSGGNVTASATGTVAGVKDCYSYSYATMTSYDIGPVTYEQSATNYTCPASSMQADSAIRGCSDRIEWSPVYQPDQGSCHAYCAQKGANACEWWSGTGACYVEFGSGCSVQGGFPGWWAAVF